MAPLESAARNDQEAVEQQGIVRISSRWIVFVPRRRLLTRLPVGRTLKDVNICGIEDDGTEVFAQVTYYKKSPQSHQKVESLQKYADQEESVQLIYVCQCPEAAVEHGVKFIPVKEVEEWIKKNSAYADKLLSP